MFSSRNFREPFYRLGSENWSDCGQILKRDLTACVEALDMECERKKEVKDVFKIFVLNNERIKLPSVPVLCYRKSPPK